MRLYANRWSLPDGCHFTHDLGPGITGHWLDWYSYHPCDIGIKEKKETDVEASIPLIDYSATSSAIIPRCQITNGGFVYWIDEVSHCIFNLLCCKRKCVGRAVVGLDVRDMLHRGRNALSLCLVTLMLRTECFLSHLQVDLQAHGTTWPYIGILSPTMSEDSGVKMEATGTRSQHWKWILEKGATGECRKVIGSVEMEWGNPEYAKTRTLILVLPVDCEWTTCTHDIDIES